VEAAPVGPGGPAVPAGPVGPEGPVGMVKLNTAADELPELVMAAGLPAEPVVTVPKVSVAALPVEPVKP
jgi:hypothetical protein